MKKKLNCVLLVDDNESDNFFHVRVIRNAEVAHTIEIAENGKEALDFLASGPESGEPASTTRFPELIFLDINMPMIDGWRFLELYQQRFTEQQRANTVIIMLTTSLNPADVAKADRIFGPGHYRYKPLTEEMLREILRQYFPNNL